MADTNVPKQTAPLGSASWDSSTGGVSYTEGTDVVWDLQSHFYLKTGQEMSVDLKEEDVVGAEEKRGEGQGRRRQIHSFYEVQEEIGRGSFGFVKRVTHKGNGMVCAAKFIPLNSGTRPQAYQERDILALMNHPRVTRLLDIFETRRKLVLVMELCSSEELLDHLLKKSMVTEAEIRIYIKQLLEAIEYLHRRGILHLDIKPANILMVCPDREDIKICDFGFAQDINPSQPQYSKYGTPEYVSPEIVCQNPVSKASDIWALGVVTYLCLTCTLPFAGENDRATLMNVKEGRISWDTPEVTSLSQEARDFMKGILQVSPEKRPSASECLEHHWFMEAKCREAVVIHTKSLKFIVARSKWQLSLMCNKSILVMRSISELLEYTSQSTSLGTAQHTVKDSSSFISSGSSDYEDAAFSKGKSFVQTQEQCLTEQAKQPHKGYLRNLYDGQSSISSVEFVKSTESNEEMSLLPKSYLTEKPLKPGDEGLAETSAEKTEIKQVGCSSSDTEDVTETIKNKLPISIAATVEVSDVASKREMTIDLVRVASLDSALSHRLSDKGREKGDSLRKQSSTSSTWVPGDSLVKNIFCSAAPESSELPIKHSPLQDKKYASHLEGIRKNLVKADYTRENSGSLQEPLLEQFEIDKHKITRAMTKSLSLDAGDIMPFSNNRARRSRSLDERKESSFSSSEQLQVEKMVPIHKSLESLLVEANKQKTIDEAAVSSYKKTLEEFPNQTQNYDQRESPVMSSVTDLGIMAAQQESGASPAKENGNCGFLDHTSMPLASSNPETAVLDSILNEMTCLAEEINVLIESKSIQDGSHYLSVQTTVGDKDKSVQTVPPGETQREKDICDPSRIAIYVESTTPVSAVRDVPTLLATQYGFEEFSNAPCNTSKDFDDNKAHMTLVSHSVTSSIDNKKSDDCPVMDLQEQSSSISVTDTEQLTEKCDTIHHESVQMDKESITVPHGIEAAYSLLESLILLSTTGEAGEAISSPPEVMQQPIIREEHLTWDKLKTSNIKEQLDKTFHLFLEASETSDSVEIEPEILEPYRDFTPHGSMHGVVKQIPDASLGVSKPDTRLQVEQLPEECQAVKQQKCSVLDNPLMDAKSPKSKLGKSGLFTVYRKSRSLEKVPPSPLRMLERKANTLASCEQVQLPNQSVKEKLRASVTNLSRILKGKSKSEKDSKEGSQSSLSDLQDAEALMDATDYTRRKSGLFFKLTSRKKKEKAKAPAFTEELTDQVVTLGHSFTLICRASGHPVPVICWFKDDNEIVSDDKISLSVTAEDFERLFLRCASMEDLGSYKCVATNSAGTASTSCMVTCAEGAQVVTVDERTGNVPAQLRQAHQIYTFLSEINRGRFSIIQQCWKTATGRLLAAKITPYTQETKQSVVKEYDVLKQLHHANVVQLHCAYISSSHLVLILEMCVGLELLPYIAEGVSYSEQHVRGLLQQVLNAVEYIHGNGILHLDLRSENLMVTEGSTLKVLDFGSAHICTSDAPVQIPERCMDFIENMAPEVMKGKGAGPQTDIWAVGVLTFIMLSAEYPFSTDTAYKTQKSIRKGKIKFGRCYAGLSDGAVSFIKSTLCVKPWGRPCATECLQSLWLQGAASNPQGPSVSFPTTKLKSFLRDREKSRAALSTKHSVVFV